MNSPYKPTNTRKQLDVKFSKLRRLKYNAFRWWRMYDNPNKPLDNRALFRDRILNGDFDYSHYKYQADWCEHEMNDVAAKYGDDIGRYVEETSLLRSRRKRLLEDFEKDENGKLELLIKAFSKCTTVMKNNFRYKVLLFLIYIAFSIIYTTIDLICILINSI